MTLKVADHICPYFVLGNFMLPEVKHAGCLVSPSNDLLFSTFQAYAKKIDEQHQNKRTAHANADFKDIFVDH